MSIDQHDKNIRNIMIDRYKYASSACASGDVDTFVHCQNMYFNFFTSRSVEELKEMLTIIPKGSLIFHGTPCKTTRDYPSLRPYVKGTKLSGIQHVLSEETIQKTIGTISFKMKEEVDAELDAIKKNEIKEKYTKETTKYRERIMDAMSKGISVGKSFFWANTTIDANVMVDIRLMKSMTMFITKRDILLLNYFKVFKIMESELVTRICDYVVHLLSTPPIPGSMDALILTKLTSAIDRDELKDLVNDKEELVLNIKVFVPGLYEYLWNTIPPIFKRAMAMPKEITQDKDVVDEFATGRWSSTVTTDDGINMILRNKYKDTIGDSTFIQLLNFILGFKGNYRISGYADYDPADKTLSDILAGTNICGQLGDGSQVCKEIMLLDPSKYLTYIGACEIPSFDTTAADATDKLNVTKLNLWTKLSTKLNSFIRKDVSSFTKIKWTTEKREFDPILFGTGGIYENITIFPHFRFDPLSVSQIDNLIANIEDTDRNVISINDRRIQFPHTIMGPYHPPTYQVGGGDGMDVDDDINSVEMAHILSQLKVLSPNSSGHVYSSDVYLALYKYVESMNPIITEDEESNNITDEMRDEKKYKIKTDISDIITKTLHRDHNIHQACIDELRRICETVRDDIASKSPQIQKMYDALNSVEFDKIRDGSEQLFFFYLKGSSALDLLISHDKKYISVIEASPQLTSLSKKSDLKTSDFDINVCINPKIMKSNKRSIIKNMIVNYFSSLLQKSRDIMVSTVLTLQNIRKIFASVNKSLLMQVHELETDPINVVVGDTHYVFEKFEKDDIIKQNKKITIENSPIGVTKISCIEIADNKLNNFSLLRLKVSGSSGKQHLNCHGELLDISVIDDLDEADFTWPHYHDIVTIDGINVNDLKGLCLDLNNTLLNNLVMINKNKSMKRFVRLDFVHKLLCSTLDPSDEFFTRIRDVVHDQIPKKVYCSFDNNIINLVNAVRLLAHGGTISMIEAQEISEKDLDSAPVPIPQSLINMSHEISSKTDSEQIDVQDIIKEADDLLTQQDVIEIIDTPLKPILPTNFTIKSTVKKSDDSHLSDESPSVSTKINNLVPQSSKNKSDALIITIKKLESIKSNKNKRSAVKKISSRVQNTLSTLYRYESTDIKRSIKEFTSLNSTTTIKDTYYLMYLLFALMYGQLDANNKILTTKIMQFRTPAAYEKVRSIFDDTSDLIRILDKKVISMFIKHDTNLIYTRYLKQPINIISTFSDKTIKNAHKIQSILNMKKFKDDIAEIVKFVMKLDYVPRVFRKLSNVDESKTEGWGDNFIKINNTYFVVIDEINIQLFNYQIIIDATSNDEYPHSNLWRNKSFFSLEGGKSTSEVTKPISIQQDQDGNTAGAFLLGSEFTDSFRLQHVAHASEKIHYIQQKTHPIQQKRIIPDSDTVVEPVHETNFSDSYDPSVHDSCHALAIFFPFEIPETIYDSVHMILLGEFLSSIPGILDDHNPVQYLDKLEMFIALGGTMVSTNKNTSTRKTMTDHRGKKNVQVIYADNKKAYIALSQMNL